MTQQVREPRPSQARLAEGPTNDSQSTPAETWRREAAAVLEVLARTGQPFTADTLLQLVGGPPRYRQIGAAFAAAQRQRLIEAVGGTIGEGNRLVRVWVRCHR